MAKYKLSDIFEGNYPVSQAYGVNAQYYSQFGLNGHEGTDYATPVGVNVLAPFDGKILRDNDSFVNNAYGNFVVVWDPVQKCAVWHCHLSSNSVSVGQEVKRGQVVGRTGNSGNSSGPHLHENFVETDAAGNRLNANNGKQGFVNILDPALVEWVPITSSPTQPMDRRPYWFDLLNKVIWNKPKEQMTDKDVTDFTAEYPNQKAGNGKWSQLLNFIFQGNVDSNKVTVAQATSKIVELQGGFTQQDLDSAHERGRKMGINQVISTAQKL